MRRPTELSAHPLQSPSSFSSSNPLPSPSPISSPSSLPSPSPRLQLGRTVQLVSPQYVIYTDTELELARSAFFDKQRAGDGKEGYFSPSKDLHCRLIRNTITSMISIKSATEDDFKYPCIREPTVMAKRLVDYYPMLRDQSAKSGAEWVRHYSSVVSASTPSLGYAILFNAIHYTICSVSVLSGISEETAHKKSPKCVN